jgi:hypothetical protein
VTPRELHAYLVGLAVEAGADPAKAHERMAQEAQVWTFERDGAEPIEAAPDALPLVIPPGLAPLHVRMRELPATERTFARLAAMDGEGRS